MATWDFSVVKDTPVHLLGEKASVQFRMEAFNLLNHPVWGNPNSNALSAGFGTITGTAVSMRQVQLALKYKF